MKIEDITIGQAVKFIGGDKVAEVVRVLPANGARPAKVALQFDDHVDTAHASELDPAN